MRCHVPRSAHSPISSADLPSRSSCAWPVSAANASFTSSNSKRSAVTIAVATGAIRNAVAKRSSLCRNARSACLRGSRSMNVNSMHASSFMSIGCPATTTAFVLPSASFSTASICGIVAPSPSRSIARSRRSAWSSTSISYTERPSTSSRAWPVRSRKPWLTFT